jgi:hypothetical protein
MLPARKFVYLFENRVCKAIGGLLLLFHNKRRDAVVTKKLHGAILRIADSIGMEDHDVARVKDNASLVIGRVFDHSKRKAGQADFFTSPAVQ